MSVFVDFRREDIVESGVIRAVQDNAGNVGTLPGTGIQAIESFWDNLGIRWEYDF